MSEFLLMILISWIFLSIFSMIVIIIDGGFEDGIFYNINMFGQIIFWIFMLPVVILSALFIGVIIFANAIFYPFHFIFVKKEYRLKFNEYMTNVRS